MRRRGNCCGCSRQKETAAALNAAIAATADSSDILGVRSNKGLWLFRCTVLCYCSVKSLTRRRPGSVCYS